MSEQQWKSDWLVADKAANIGCKYGKQYAIKYGFVVVDQPTGNFVQVKLCLLSKQEEHYSEYKRGTGSDPVLIGRKLTQHTVIIVENPVAISSIPVYCLLTNQAT